MVNEELVVLVDEQDNEIGLMGKMAAHREGRLHRAISIFLFNDQGQMLLQQRAFSKYHSGGLWSNTCCSHPRHNESVLDAAHRRLLEEMGIRCELKNAFDFIYRAALGNGLTEHEFDHVLVGKFNGEPILNPDEAASWKWADVDVLAKDVAENPQKYTAWFKVAFCRVISACRTSLALCEGLSSNRAC